MIKNARVKNFKCFGPEGVDFDLAKINFIFGDNSSGKSSLIQFLEWAGRIVEDPKKETVLTADDVRVYKGKNKGRPSFWGEGLNGICLSNVDQIIEDNFKKNGHENINYLLGMIRCCDSAKVESEIIFMPMYDHYWAFDAAVVASPKQKVPITKEEYARLGAFVVQHHEAGRDAYETIDMNDPPYSIVKLFEEARVAPYGEEDDEKRRREIPDSERTIEY